MILNYRHLAQDILNKDGKKIKSNTIVRCAYPAGASEEQLKEIGNLDSIFDFRGDDEIASDPMIEYDGVKTVNYKIGGDFNKGQNQDPSTVKFALEDMCKFYAEVLPYNEEIRTFFSDLKANKQNFMFHCTAGKDRTGTVGIILMSILDFDLESIKNEYLQIDPMFITAMTKKIESMGITVDDSIKDVLTVKEEFFNSLIDSVTEKYGSLENYIKEYLNISDEDKQAFKDYYLV